METTTAKEAITPKPTSPLDDQIKFCQDRRAEWEPALVSPGEVGLAAKKNVAMYEALEASLIKLNKLISYAKAMVVVIDGEAKEESRAKSPETRIKEKQLKTIQ